MKLLIEIKDQEQALQFLYWVANRGDILMGDNCDFKPAEGMASEEVKNRYVYVNDATAV